MSTVKRIYRNIVFLSSGEIVSKILQFVLMIYAARVLDKASFGKFNFAISLSFLAIVIADLGINTLLIREISRNKKSVGQYFVNSITIKLFMSLAAFILMAVFLNFMGYSQSTKEVVYVIWIFTIISTFTELFYSVFRAFEDMFFDFIIRITRAFIVTAVGIFALFKYESVVVFSAAFLIAEAIVFLLAYLIAMKKFNVGIGTIDFKLIKKILKDSFPFWLSFVFSTIYFYISSVMLSKMKGDVEVASFSAAYNIVFAILFIPNVYVGSIYPVMSRYFKRSKENLKLIYSKSFKYLIIIGLPISVGIYLLSKDIMLLLYGDKYLSSYIALQIISWYIFIKFLNTLMGFFLLSIDRQGSRMLSQGITALIIIILNLILIPKMGFSGAAIATFAAEIVLFSMYYFFASKFGSIYNPLPVFIKSFFAVCAMALLINYFGHGLFLKIAIGAVSYFAIVIALKSFDNEDIKMIKRIMKKDN